MFDPQGSIICPNLATTATCSSNESMRNSVVIDMLMQQNSALTSQAFVKPVKIQSPQSPEAAMEICLQTSPRSKEPMQTSICAVCKDHATGRHYGVMSCDGCKGFFRRTIRQGLQYECRFQRNCVIERGRRNVCRSCRYQRCLDAGMRKEAVQEERDKLMKKSVKQEQIQRKLSSSQQSQVAAGLSFHDGLLNLNQISNSPATTVTAQMPPQPPKMVAHAHHQHGGNVHVKIEPQAMCALSEIGYCDRSNYRLFVNCLLGGEEIFARLRKALAQNQSPNDPPSLASQQSAAPSAYKVATIDDLAYVMRQQLLAVTELLKLVPIFRGLPLDDQVALLKAYSAEYLLLTLAHRSLPYDGFLLLSDEMHICHKNFTEMADINHIVSRILDELVAPMRRLQLDTVEYTCLKAIAFFNPDVCGPGSSEIVDAKRQILLATLENYIADKPQRTTGRVGNLFLLLPKLQSIAQQMRECIQLTSLLGYPKIDSFLQELLGGGTLDGVSLSLNCQDQASSAMDATGAQQQPQMVTSSNSINNCDTVPVTSSTAEPAGASCSAMPSTAGASCSTTNASFLPMLNGTMPQSPDELYFLMLR